MTVVVLLAFSISSIIVFLLIALKTPWFKSWPGRILAMDKFALFLTGIYLLGRWAGWLDAALWAPIYYYGVLGGLAVVHIFNIIFLLKRNWRFWAWNSYE